LSYLSVDSSFDIVAYVIDAAPEQAAPGSVAGLSFDHVGMTFPDGTHAVADATFSVDRGEFVTIVGPSGCGKSTLLRIASGLLQHTQGAVTIDRQRIGYVFQDPTLMPWRTVRGNVELLAELHGLPREERWRLAQQAIDLVGLTGFERHYPKSLSGGMRMRCSLARTLTLEPPIMLFDEPFGSVDEITRERLNEEALRLFERQRFAGLFITHSISEAVFLSTRVLVMSARPGRIFAESVVPFPYPRDPDLRFDPRFAEISGAVSHVLRAGTE
jgi:NitT/TauT family transport system ATP-binding protein